MKIKKLIAFTSIILFSKVSFAAGEIKVGDVLPVGGIHYNFTDVIGSDLGDVKCTNTAEGTVEKLNVDGSIIYKFTNLSDGTTKLKNMGKLGFTPHIVGGRVIFVKSFPYVTNLELTKDAINFSTTFMSAESVIRMGGAKNYSLSLEIEEGCKFHTPGGQTDEASQLTDQ